LIEEQRSPPRSGRFRKLETQARRGLNVVGVEGVKADAQPVVKS